MEEFGKKYLFQYDTEMKKDDTKHDELLVKIMYRCVMNLRSVEKLKKVFDMLHKKEQLKKTFLERKDKNEQKKAEKSLTLFCL